MSQMGKEEFQKELAQLEDLYEQTTGEKMSKFYRPPQGKYSDNNLQLAKELGYRTIFWSLAYVDWKQEEQPTHEEAMSKLLKEFIRERLYCCTIRPGRTVKFWMRF